MSHSSSPAVHGLRWTTAGESHGPCLVAVLEGLPAAMPIDWDAVSEGMRRRWKGYGRGPRAKFEKDVLKVLGGIKNGVTLGSPLALSVGNSDTRIDTLPNLKAPRPGHADLAGAMRSKTRDLRAVLERASARETAARTALGEVARQLLAQFGITVKAETLEIGGTPRGSDPETPAWNETIRAAHERGDSLGGVFQVRVEGCPPGLGGLEQPVDRLDVRLMAALASIPAIRGVEIGLGFRGASTPGSKYHDGIVPEEAGWAGVGRSSNRCGGIEGGLTNGQAIELRAVMKPIPTMRHGADSVKMETLESSRATYERSDVCSVEPASVVGEIVVCLELASALRARLGGWTLAEMRERFATLGGEERLSDWPDDLSGRS
ncbi:MAG: chorismate synthase [Planctomycetes bacterium]|nr:chorismate synthase [Planctomycetota bacterium]